MKQIIYILSCKQPQLMRWTWKHCIILQCTTENWFINNSFLKLSDQGSEQDVFDRFFSFINKQKIQGSPFSSIEVWFTMFVGASNVPFKSNTFLVVIKSLSTLFCLIFHHGMKSNLYFLQFLHDFQI